MSQVNALLDLQELDLAIGRERKHLAELPEKTALLELRAKKHEVTELRAKGELLLGKLRKDLKAHQDEIFTLTQKIDAEQAKVMETTDHRVVQSITREMDGLRRRRDKVENESLGLMERIDKATGQVATIDEALEKLEQKEAVLTERYKTVGQELQLEIAKLEVRRAEVAKSLDAELLERYESLRKVKGGIGVGRLEAGGCTACRMQLPAQRVRALESGPAVGVCPQCNRLIVTHAKGDGE
ncbi:MAG: zinc ribbon domain-containing protein [Coriobacteriia bacterium]